MLCSHSQYPSTNTNYSLKIIYSDLTKKTQLSFISSNSSFIECVTKHNPHQTYSIQKDTYLSKKAFYHSLLKKQICNDITRETYFSTEHLTTTSDSFKSCRWDSCSSTEAGGAIYLQEDYPLTVIDCSFISCTSQSSSPTYEYGGGAIAFLSSGLLDIQSTSFICCSAVGMRGGAVHIRGTGDAAISAATIFDCCCSKCGGGFLIENGPSFALSDSSFVACETQIGGACGFHRRKSTFSVSNCIFAKNHASHSSRGGGAAEDNVYDPLYCCKYSFSFFSQNIAEVGTDIAANRIAYISSPTVHCFTTTKENSFSNLGTYKDNWLLMNNSFLEKERYSFSFFHLQYHFIY